MQGEESDENRLQDAARAFLPFFSFREVFGSNSPLLSEQKCSLQKTSEDLEDKHINVVNLVVYCLWI